MPRVKRTESGGFLLPLANAKIDSLRFDGGGVELSLNSDFAKLSIGSSAFALLWSKWPDFDQWLSLAGRRVLRAEASESGDLDLDIDDGRRLRIEHDPDYEAWQFADNARTVVVSRPAGAGIAWWEDD
jgi:Family of unknown function (DUF6188)